VTELLFWLCADLVWRVSSGTGRSRCEGWANGAWARKRSLPGGAGGAWGSAPERISGRDDSGVGCGDMGGADDGGGVWTRDGTGTLVSGGELIEARERIVVRWWLAGGGAGVGPGELWTQATEQAGSDVNALVAMNGEVWRGVGKDVEVWGKRA
jgi:hypothetical protein